MKDNISLKKLLETVAKPENRLKLILLAGIAGILIIFLSDRISDGTEQTSSDASDSSYSTAYVNSYDEYAAQLEERLVDMISSIEGAGETKVMITLECGTEYVYAYQQKSTSSISEDSDSDGKSSRDEKSTSEDDLILIDGDDGEEPLILKEVSPTVAGVVVVCNGADNINVKQQIVDIVTTALGTTSNRVCVTSMG